MNRYEYAMVCLNRAMISAVAALGLTAAGGSAHGDWLEEGKELLKDFAGDQSAGGQLSAEQIVCWS